MDLSLTWQSGRGFLGFPQKMKLLGAWNRQRRSLHLQLRVLIFCVDLRARVELAKGAVEEIVSCSQTPLVGVVAVWSFR